MAGSAPSCQPRASVAGDIFTPGLPKKVLGAALGAVLSGLVFIDSQAQARVVNVGGLDYDVTTFYGSYNDNVSKFNTPNNGGMMPWWGSSGEAFAFATAVGSGLGLPNFNQTGPYFGFTFFVCPPSSCGSSLTFVVEQRFSSLTPGVFSSAPSFAYPHRLSDQRTWAQATLAPAAGGSANVPGPLPILGLAAAFGFSRKLRKRIKLQKVTSDISTSAVK